MTRSGRPSARTTVGSSLIGSCTVRRRASRRARPARRWPRRGAATVPSNGALSASSIFIASSTTEHLAGLDPVAVGDADVEHGAGHRRGDRAVAGVEPRGRRRRPAARRRTAGPGATTSTSAERRRPRRAAGRRRRRGRPTSDDPARRARRRPAPDGAGQPEAVGRGTAAVGLRGRRRQTSQRARPSRGGSRAVGRRGDLVRGRARRCRWSRRGTRRSRPAPAGSRRWWSGRGSRCRRARRPAPAGRASRSAPCDDHLAEHRVVRRADDLAALERVVDPHARPATARSVAVPAWGRKPPNESSAYTRASMAWPVTVTSSWVIGSGSPAATRSWSSTRSSPVISLGDRVLDLEPGVHLQEVGLAGVVVERGTRRCRRCCSRRAWPARPRCW